jgi:hypothetical protein
MFQTFEKVQVKLGTFLILTLDGGEWSVSCSRHLTEGKIVQNPEGWMGPRAHLDAVTKRKIPADYKSDVDFVQLTLSVYK